MALPRRYDHDDVDTMQQASLLADQALLEVRRVRREEGGHCGA